MVNKSQLAVAFGIVGCVILGVGQFHYSRVAGQGVKAVFIQTQPALPKPGAATTLAAQFSGIKLVENSSFRQYLNVARDCIKDKAWQDAVTALQTILDNKEDSYAQVTEVGPDGKKMLRWTSVKFEANNLLGSMAEEGLDVYEQRFGAVAKNKLMEAKTSGNRELMAEVAQRFLHTRAGIEANDLLATYFMDRGQFFMAALRFEKLFSMNPARVKVDDLTLFKATLSFRRAGDMKNEEAVWRKLEPRLRDQGGLKVGADVVAIAELDKFLKETPRAEAARGFDWPYVRGNVTNSAQAQGSPPLLDVILFKRDTVRDKGEDGDDDRGSEAETRIKNAVLKQNDIPNNPVMPGFFPIASNNRLIYRSYYDVRAVYIHDEKDSKGEVIKAGSIAWKSTDFDGALANLLADSKKKPTLDSWLTRYHANGGFSSLVYENTLNGTLSTDHRLVYAIDDLAVPAPVDQLQPYNWNSGSISQDVKPLVLQNTLYAINLVSGKLEWRLGGSVGDPFADSHFLGVPIAVGGKLYVLNEKNAGPTGDGDLRLVCIDPHKLVQGGEGQQRPTIVEPIQSLGNVMLQHRITHDISRRLNATHLGYGEGILVCPTNAGEVLGVDLMSRSLAWAYPYRERMPSFTPFATFQPQPGFRVQPSFASLNTATWRSAPPVIQDGKVVFTAPDADSVHCVNLRDGTFVWKKKQSENDLYLAGVYNGKVLIVGKTAVRALNLEDGRQLWYVPTGDLPSGQGVASQNVYYLPLKRGEIMALDIDSGRIKAHNRARTGGVSPGNLVFYDGTVLSQTPMQIVAYPQLAARLELARANLQADPTNPSKLVDYGELLLANGQVRAAAVDLKKALARKPDESLQARARLKLYEALTDLLTTDFLGSSDLYLDEYRELCNVPDNLNEQQLRQARYFRIVGQGREAQGNLVDAFLMYREFGALPIHREHGGIASLDDPSHKVPTNVWLRGRVSAMIAKATPEQRAPLEKKIAEEWKTVEAKKDSDAIRSFVGMFDVPFAVGREARLQLADIITDTNDRPNFLEAELSLNQLRGADYKSDPRSGGRALAVLARLEEKKGSASSMKLAAAYYRELQREFANVPVRTEKNSARTGADFFNDMATDPRFRPYLEEPASPWENVKIGVRELPAGTITGGPQGFIFQPDGDLTPLMKQHRLVLDPVNASSPQLRLIDLSTNTVRWTQTLGTVPQNYQYFQYLYTQGQANNHYFPNAKFRYFQVKGSLVVFQVGTMVYCLDADNARVLWQQSLLEAGNANQPVTPGVMVHQIFPDADGYLELAVSNPSNGQRTRAPIGHVGAVQASYVALATQKGLMVVDPLRGTLLWKKTDIPASTRVFGDENYIYLVETSEGSAGSGRVLRASDGVQIPAADFGGIYQNRLKLSGRRILAAFPGRDGLVLKLHDIVSGKSIWSKTFDAKAMVLQTEDANLTGVIDPSGQVTILDVSTGATLLHASVIHGRVTAEELKGLKDPLLIHDADRYYIALNKPIDPAKVARGILANNFSNGLRCGTVNGWFVALHRQAGERKAGDKTIKWKAGDVDWHTYAPLLNQLVVLEQFDQLPVILFSARFEELLNGGAGGNRWVSVTQSIDKRSGKMVFDPPRPKLTNSAAQYSAFQVDPKNGTITMIGFTGAIQHFIDDGRKLANAQGITLGGVQSTDSADGGNNPPARVMGPGGFGFPGLFPGDAPIRRPVIRVVPGTRD